MFHRLPRERDRESLRPLPLASAGFRVLHLKHSVLLAKLLAPQLGQIQSPGRGSLPPPLPLSPLPPFSPLSPPRSSRSSPRACFSRRFLNQSGVPLSELLSLRRLFPAGWRTILTHCGRRAARCRCFFRPGWPKWLQHKEAIYKGQ